MEFEDIFSDKEKTELLGFFEEILGFVKDVKPLIDNINESIKENIINKMPTAAKKISSVSEATENATTEILNTLDGVFPKIDKLTSEIKDINKSATETNNYSLEFLELLRDSINNNIDLTTLLPHIDNAIKALRANQDKIELGRINKIEEDLNAINEDATSIMMSLQVQDITAQQLASVKHLLDTIELKMKSIMAKLQNEDIENIIDKVSSEESGEDNVTKLHREVAFDANAVDTIAEREDRQKMADELSERERRGEDISDSEEETETKVEKEKDLSEEIEIKDEKETEDNKEEEQDEPTDSKESVSQDDIDALFDSANGDDTKEEEESKAEPEAEKETREEEKKDKEKKEDEKDNPLSGLSDSDNISQGDIDKLFDGQ